jgi:hypothetical protein
MGLAREVEVMGQQGTVGGRGKKGVPRISCLSQWDRLNPASTLPPNSSIASSGKLSLVDSPFGILPYYFF